MIIGIGADIFQVSRLLPLAGAPDDPFFRRAFTENARRQAHTRPDPILYFCTRYAGKEAVYKALSQDGCDFRPAEIEILDDETGRPETAVWGATRTALEKYPGVRIWISLSWEGDYAAAFAVAEIPEGERTK